MSYAYTDYVWPALISSVLTAALAWYAWRHRGVAGARPFALGCLFATAWSLGALLEIAGQDATTKVFWLRFLTIWQLPVVTAATFFLLEYAGLRRKLPARRLSLLWVPPILFAAVVATDHLHHLAWTGFPLVDDSIAANRGVITNIALIYSYLVAAFNVGVLVWLFATSPRHRWPAGLLVAGQLGARAVFELGTRTGVISKVGMDPVVLLVLFGLYAVALFRFHVFDPVPAARAMALEQMQEGMLVLDVEGRIAYVNPAAERALGRSAAALRGLPARDTLPFAELVEEPALDDPPALYDLDPGTGAAGRHYAVGVTSLRDKRGEELGRLILLHDVTEQTLAQAQVVEHERALAVLREREHLARELHDGVAQVLGFLGLQAQTVGKILRDGDVSGALPLVDRLAEVARGAQVEVRDSILALKAGSSKDWEFLSTLRRYLDDVRDDHGLQAELLVGAGVRECTFDPRMSVQVLRVIQEALTNARRHGKATKVKIEIERLDGWVHVAIIDDGSGFDPTVAEEHRGHFGLGFMRERMAEVGGSIEVDSRPGGGTRVSLQAPLG